MTEAETITPGQLIDDRYRIEQSIAEGGMATVYKAHDERLERTVALKVMHTQLAQGPQRDQFVERFHREARSAAAIANQHIVQVYDTGEWHGLSFLVMEYVHGVNLRQEMNSRGTFDVRETVRIVSQTLDGLASAHRVGVIHRDIKPENILLNDRGRVQITDFGLARAVSQATVSTTGMLLGTAAYLPPEIIENNEATPQGDLYSVGIMAWEMISGSVPFLSDNSVTMVFKHVHEDVPPLSETCPGIDQKISDFVSHLTVRDLHQRPNDADAAMQELQALAAELDADAWNFRVPPAVPAPPQPAQARSAASNSGTESLTQSFTAMQTAQITSQIPGKGKGKQASQSPAQANDAHGAAPATAKNKTGSKRRRTIWISILAALAVVALAGGGTGWWYFLGPGSYWAIPKPDDLQCGEGVCPIKNVQWSRYESTLKVAGIPYKVTQDFSDTVDKGKIISTSPDSVNSKLSKRNGAQLTVTVSKGVRQSTIPQDITATQTKDPIKALRDAGFTNIEHDTAKDAYSQTLPEGVVSSIDPAPGTTLKHNAKITVVLSKGPMPVSMPDVTGRTKDEAQSAFDDAKLNANYSEEYNDTVAAGTVISASVPKGTQLHWGDSVNVKVSKGPQMVTVPDVKGKNEDEASKILQSMGLGVKISSPLGDITHTVRLQSPDPGQQVPVHDKDGNATVITLTVV